MKIAATDLALQSDHLAATRQQSSETLRAWRGERPDFEALESTFTDISRAARQLLAADNAVSSALPTNLKSGAADAVDASREAVDNDPFLSMIRQMIEFLTGEKVRVFDMQSFSAEMHHVEVQSSDTQAQLQTANSGRSAWGMEYDYHAVSEEFEQTTFSASGTVRTADGQEISFTLDLEMTRYHREETSVSLRAGNAVRKDPLVVNFGGTAAQLQGASGQHFKFDLDGNGQAELLPLFASGSGFLAFDLNGNGKIDSGRELFGPQSGDGFTDLAKLDDDKNGWIDENDAAFDRLSVWTPAAEGAGNFRKLADLGIGALGLQHVSTPFALRDQGNGDLGMVKSSGVFLTEDGKAGNLQEIDMTI